MTPEELEKIDADISAWMQANEKDRQSPISGVAAFSLTIRLLRLILIELQGLMH